MSTSKDLLEVVWDWAMSCLLAAAVVLAVYRSTPVAGLEAGECMV